MKRAYLLSTIAAGLLLSTAAFAQAPAKDDSPAAAAPAPAAQQKAPAEKTAPNMKAGEKNAQTHKAPETTGQAPAASDAGKAGVTDKKSMDKGAADKPMNKGAADTGKNPAAATTTAPASPKSAETPAAAPKSGQAASDPAKSTTSSQTTTGQGSAAGVAKLSTEQRTKITTVFKSQKVERIEPSKLNISISVGTRVPSTVHYYPIPQEVIVIYPEWRGYDYIMVGDQIVVVDPRSHEIVAILEA